MNSSIHFICELILFILGALVFFTIFLFNSVQLEISFNVLTDMFSTWKSRPIDSIQISKFRSCPELRMVNLMVFKWPGNIEFCLDDDCTKNDAVKVLASKADLLTKWKGHNICGSYIKHKSYFELSKSENSSCFSRHKNCGIIDTLGNFLCIPDTEQCPVNKLNIRKNLNENNFNIEIGNNNPLGKVVIRFLITEGVPCVVLSEKNLSFLESRTHKYLVDLPLKLPRPYSLKAISNTVNGIQVPNNYDFAGKELKEKYVNQCSKYIKDKDNKKNWNYFNSNIVEVDESLTPDFLRVNNLDIYKVALNKQMKLHTVTYKGWKKECETNAFFNFIRMEQPQNEVIIIQNFIDENYYTMLYVGLILIVGISMSFLVKQNILLKNNYVASFTICHLPVIISSMFLIYISNKAGYVLHDAKNTNSFFELTNNHSCSDELTNSELSFISHELFSLIDSFFNLKIFCIVIVFMTIAVYVIPLKNKYERSKKKNSFDQYNKLA